MLRVLIVDDEPIVREGLKTIIDWEEHGFTICGEAVNGADGLEKILGLRPDIAIVDIRMPDMDGFGMIEELQSHGCDCRIVILTAYADFGFARKALELGADSYLLKPVEQTELAEKMDKMRRDIEDNLRQRRLMDESMLLSRDKVLENIVLGRMDAEAVERYGAYYGLGFPWEGYRLALAEVNPENLSSDIKAAWKTEIQKTLCQYGCGFAFDIDGRTGMILQSVPLSQCKRAFEEMNAQLKHAFEAGITVAAGHCVNRPEELRLSYENARRLMERKFIFRGDSAVMEAPPADGAMQESAAGPHANRITEGLCSAMAANDATGMEQLLIGEKNRFIYEDLDENAIKMGYANLFASVFNGLTAFDDGMRPPEGELRKAFDGIYAATSLRELHRFALKSLTALSGALTQGQSNDPIRRMRDYIDRNCGKDIKLETLAAAFNYNSNYLGRLFRAGAGMPFNSYLDRARLEKAKRLLAEGCKVYEAAENCGYKDIVHFYRKFKKYTGASPSEYKRKSE